jgi:hypothetical protein
MLHSHLVCYSASLVNLPTIPSEIILLFLYWSEIILNPVHICRKVVSLDVSDLFHVNESCVWILLFDQSSVIFFVFCLYSVCENRSRKRVEHL